MRTDFDVCPLGTRLFGRQRRDQAPVGAEGPRHGQELRRQLPPGFRRQPAAAPSPKIDLAAKGALECSCRQR